MANNSIFSEYIGRGPSTLSDFPGEIINSEISKFHFLLAFAEEIGTGSFNPTWNETYFGPDHIKKLKDEHTNVKLLISIGGYQFNPSEIENWIDNAETYLGKIFTRYSNLIDGIDVSYEDISKTITSDKFAYCIGELSRRLLKKKLINVVSISPSASVLPQYVILFKKYDDIIDWVNYQFYGQTLTSVNDFENRFTSLCASGGGIFPNEKFLAGYSTDPKDAGKITSDVFFGGCKRLHDNKLLHGIFIWNANYSKIPSEPFIAEKRAQRILTETESTT